MKHKISVKSNGDIKIIEAGTGENLLDVLHTHEFNISSPCGGNGTCGKCRVKVNSPSSISEKEAKLLGKNALQKGYRLACYQIIDSDLMLETDDTAAKGVIMTSMHDIEMISNPDIEIKHIEIEKPSLSDQRGNLNRVLDNSCLFLEKLELDLMYKISNLIDSEKTKATTVSYDDKLIDIAEGWIEKIYALAVDIGTTTVAVYLVDTAKGRIVDVDSFYNPQKRFGADVISRIDHVNKTKNLKLLSSVIIEKLNESIERLSKKNNISQDLIYSAFFVGNTTMIHFLLTLDPRNIANAPFVPQTTKAHRAEAVDFSLDINRKGYIFTLPMVSAYIGADTVGAVLSSGMYKNMEQSIMLDLGTNGEIVLGNSEHLISCSAAAGPAFEGANIRSGMAGIPGAIDKIMIEDGELIFTTIGDLKPAGICGSAIIDIAAQMLRSDIIDETGRFYDADEIEDKHPELAKRRIRIDGMEAFVIHEGDGSDDVIAVTQKDVREIQNAKAAIAAGIKVLLDKKGLDYADIDTLYLAGGFGSFVNVKNAAVIGLIPKELEDKVISVGNAAGAGAILAAISYELYNMSMELSQGIEYIELSSSPVFTGYYMEEMLFE